MEQAAPYAVNWQIKQSPLGVEQEAEAPTDLVRLLKIIRLSGYRGYLPIETLSARGKSDYDPYVVVPKFLAELRAAMAATESIAPPAPPEEPAAPAKPAADSAVPARKPANKK